MHTHDQKIRFQSMSELIAAFSFYAVVTVVAYTYGPHLPRGWIRNAALMSPLLPFALLPIVVFRTFRRIDEYQRRKALENWAFAALLSFVFCFIYGLGENIGWRPFPIWAVCPLMGMSCGMIEIVRCARER